MNNRLFRLAIFCVLLCATQALFAQSSRYMTADELRVPTAYELVGVDFEIKSIFA